MKEKRKELRRKNKLWKKRIKERQLKNEEREANIEINQKELRIEDERELEKANLFLNFHKIVLYPIHKFIYMYI